MQMVRRAEAISSAPRSIRAGSGLGDSLYLQGVVRHLVGQGAKLEVLTNWPDLFRPLAGRITVSRFRRAADIYAHYARRRGHPETDQFRDCCIGAGIAGPAELRLDWTLTRSRLVDRLRGAAAGRPIILVQMPREPMGRADGFAMELLPDCRTIQRAIDRLAGRALLVQVGKGAVLYRFRGIDIDLANQTTVRELLDVAAISSGALGYCSYIVPLAESFARPALLVWSRRGLASGNELIRRLVPAKVLHRPSSRAVWDDCGDDELARAVDALVEQARGPAPV